MVDFHTHILPAMDDGSRNVEESLRMLRTLKEQGVDKVIATSHFYAKRDTPESFLDRRARRIAELQEAIRTENTIENVPEVILGAEVHYFNGISRCEEIRNLAIEGTNLLLLELPFGEWNDAIVAEVDAVGRNLGLQVVIAHLDRYYAIRSNKKYIQKLLELDVLLQINIEAFLTFRTSGRMTKLLKDEQIFALGSDCHNMGERAPRWREFNGYIGKKKLDSELNRMKNLLYEQL